MDSMDYWRGLAREYLARQGLAPSPELLERIKPMSCSSAPLDCPALPKLSLGR